MSLEGGKGLVNWEIKVWILKRIKVFLYSEGCYSQWRMDRLMCNLEECIQTTEEFSNKSSISGAEKEMCVSSAKEFSHKWVKHAVAVGNDWAYRTGKLACIQDVIHYQRFLHISHRFVKFLQVSLIFNLHVKGEERSHINKKWKPVLMEAMLRYPISWNKWWWKSHTSFTVAKQWKQFKSPSTDGEVNCGVYIQ